MRKMMKQLRAIADLLEYKVTIRRQKVQFVMVSPKRKLVVCWPEGLCSILDKKISIVIHGRPSRRSVIHTFAHEIRHAIHQNAGLFKDYYRKKPRQWAICSALCRSRTAYQIEKFNLKNAWLAERDCDKWGNKFLVSFGIEPLTLRTYRYDQTSAYKINKMLNDCTRQK